MSRSHFVSPAYYLKGAMFSALYFFAAKVGMNFGMLGENISAFWPAAGLALVFLYYQGRHFWPWVFIGSFVSVSFTDVSFKIALVAGVASASEASLGAWLLRKYCKVGSILSSSDQLIRFFPLMFLVSMTSALIGVFGFEFFGAGTGFYAAEIFHWLMGDIIGIVSVFLTILAARHEGKKFLNESLPALLSFSIVIAISTCLFILNLDLSWYFFSAILLLPSLILVSLLGRSTTLATAIISSLILSGIGAAFGYGIFEVSHTLILYPMLQVFNLVSIVVSSLVLVQKLERQYINQDLDHEKSRIEEVLEMNTDGWWDWDLTNREDIYLSPGFKHLFGYNDHELPNKISSVERIINHDDMKISMGNLEKHLTSNGQYPFYQESRYRHKDGHTVWVICKGRAIRNASGKFTRMVGIHVDITRLKQLQIQFERSNKALEQFASVAAHDLRAPLKSMRSWIDMLDLHLGAPRKREIDQAITFIQENATKADRLISALLNITRVDDFDFRRSSVDLNNTVEGIVSVLKPEIDRTNAVIRFDQLPVVSGNPSYLESVFTNLIQNALVYRSESREPEIVVGLRESNEEYEFFVRDNGIGIESQYLDRIFEMFKRLHGDARYRGTGIGLALCKKVIELYGGKIWVDSVPGEGSTFFFTYPKSWGTFTPREAPHYDH